ncbi:MAG: hypothetical protein ACC663_08665 [Gammaproteobacteria bacterium]
MKKYFYLPGILIATFLFASSASAELPGWYPKSFFLAGFVDSLQGSSITIDNLPLLLSPTAKFATESNADANIKNLKIGQMVGVETIVINKRRLVDRIWLIPENEYSKFNPPQ